ncbi:MAG TPA: aspartate carbamoyltransferase catalytic subunit [Polyangiaceae bacterium]|nr:aspartate carbamoyltransferase catalytic subunit [Polyangiaceae bacterium]
MTKLEGLLGIEPLDKSAILAILDRADVIHEDPRQRDTLAGKTVVNLFMEASTRTRTSFEIAAKRLGAHAVNVSESFSSSKKGETLLDTARNLDAMGPAAIVLRHASSGSPAMVARHVRARIVNAGDGTHEHPTQALLDCGTIRRHKGRVEGLTVTIVGDILHSRVARSNLHALGKLGAVVRVAGPRSLLPRGVEGLGALVYDRIEPALEGADVVMVLRLQHERMAGGYVPSLRDYSRFFGVNARNIRAAKHDAIVMHPGPINRGVELSSDVADGARSVILDQVAYGVSVRMAVLEMVAGAF